MSKARLQFANVGNLIRTTCILANNSWFAGRTYSLVFELFKPVSAGLIQTVELVFHVTQHFAIAHSNYQLWQIAECFLGLFEDFAKL